MSKPNLSNLDIERFWGKVDRRGPDECWPWLAFTLKQRGGYGHFSISSIPHRAHRIAYLIAHPEWNYSSDDKVLHSCDNPVCQNPKHLSLGTDLDNVHDMVAKGRQAKGERQHLSVLDTNQVKEIKKRLRGREKQLDLAKEYGVTPANISAINRGISWSWVSASEN